MSAFFLTALRDSPQKQEDLSVPKVVSLDTTAVVKAIPIVEDGKERMIVKYAKERYTKTIKAAERLGEYLLQTDFNNAASSPYNTGTKQNVAASGTGAASAQAITSYHVSITAATAGSNTGVRLPNASAAGRLGTAMVVFNKTAVDAVVYPAASESLDSSTAGTETVKAGQFKHFYVSTTAAWVTCKGPYA